MQAAGEEAGCTTVGEVLEERAEATAELFNKYGVLPANFLTLHKG